MDERARFESKEKAEPRQPDSAGGQWAMAGGGEFQPLYEPMDRALLAATGHVRPRVAILPTAAQENPALVAAHGVAHFERLGAQAEAVMIVDSLTANDAGLTDKLLAADLIYLSGGDPQFLMRTLSGSRTQEALERAFARRVLVCGSSAGAMVLGTFMVNRYDELQPGLGLAGPFAVLPHYSTARHARARGIASRLSAGTLLLGLPEACGISGADSSWQVLGAGGIHVWQNGAARKLAAGETLRIA